MACSIDQRTTDPARLSRRRVVGGAGVLAIGGALGAFDPAAGRVGVGAAARQEPTTLVVASYGSPVDLDPHSAVEDRSALAIRGPYESLIALKGGSAVEYEGVLAESWSANDDQGVWTFTLRPGLAFHDGTPCDAEAVRLSFERLLALGLAPAYEFYRFLDDPARISAPDPLTVVFDLGRPQPLFEAAASSQYGSQIVNAAALREREEGGDWGHAWAELNTEGMGTGPYRIVGYDPGNQVELERFEGYWRGWEADHFDRIFVRVIGEDAVRRQLVEAGEVDIADSLPPEAGAALEPNPDLVVDRSYSSEVVYCILTVAGPLATAEARRAMCYAFPYDDVVEGVYRGFARRAVGPVAEVVRGFDPGTFVYPTDLDEARRLFAEAGVAEGTELSMMLLADSPEFATVAQLLQANLAEVGITLRIEEVDYATFTAVLFRDVDPEEQPNVMLWSWWPAYNDAWAHLQAQITCASAGSAGTNAGYFCDEQVDALMNEARDATDEETYRRAIGEVQQRVSRDNPPAIYYLQRQWVTALRGDVAGYTFNPIYVGTYDFYALRRA